MHFYSFPSQSDITGIRRPFDGDDEQDWQEKSLYSRRHDGLFKSRLEQMQEEWLAQQEESDMI
jgi:hypothetical protein